MKNRVQTTVLSAPVGGAAAQPLPANLVIPDLSHLWRRAPAVDVERNTAHSFQGIRWGAQPSRRIGY